jgi:hypothetical protein
MFRHCSDVSYALRRHPSSNVRPSTSADVLINPTTPLCSPMSLCSDDHAVPVMFRCLLRSPMSLCSDDDDGDDHAVPMLFRRSDENDDVSTLFRFCSDVPYARRCPYVLTTMTTTTTKIMLFRCSDTVLMYPTLTDVLYIRQRPPPNVCRCPHQPNDCNVVIDPTPPTPLCLPMSLCSDDDDDDNHDVPMLFRRSENNDDAPTLIRCLLRSLTSLCSDDNDDDDDDDDDDDHAVFRCLLRSPTSHTLADVPIF